MTVNIDTVYHDLNSLAMERLNAGLFQRLIESARKVCEMLVSDFPKGKVQVYDVDESECVGVWISQRVTGLPSNEYLRLRKDDALEYLSGLESSRSVEVRGSLI